MDTLRVVVHPMPRASHFVFESEQPFAVELVDPQYVAPQPQPIEIINNLYCACVTLWYGSKLQCKANGHTFEIKEVC